MGVAVVDASVLVDACTTAGERGRKAKLALLPLEPVAPSHARIEALSAWRRQVRHGSLSELEARGAVATLQLLSLKEIPVEPLIPRIWELRNNLTAADAAYVALAELWDVPFVTCDAALASSPGTRCEFRLVG